MLPVPTTGALTGPPLAWCDPRVQPLRARRPGPPLLAALLAVLLATSACGLFSGPSAEDEAADLAAALSAGRLTSLSFSGGTPEQAQALWERSVAGLGRASADVSVDRVTEGKDGGPSTARLSYSWHLPGSTRPWTYRTSAQLVADDSADHGFRVRLAPTLVHPALGNGGRLVRSTTPADRGDILGAGGTALVTERPVLHFGIDKTAVAAAKQPAVARALAGLLGIDVKSYVARVSAAGPKAFVEALALRPADARAALHSTAAVKGVAVVRDTVPLAPTREFARPVLGTVGPVTAEMVKASPGVYRPGDDGGLSGLEARYDEQLRGTPGLTVQAVDGRGATRELFGVDAVPGKPLETTLDSRLQRLAEDALSAVRPASALVAVRPSTGDLLAVASGPGSKGYSTATVGRYAPGSTFKVVSSLALLRAGVRPSSTLRCPATTVVDGKRFTNYSDYPAGALGRISLSTAVADSCNTAFVNERRVVSQEDLASAAASLGLGVDHDLGFPVFLGSVPKTDAEAGSATGHAASMIGQGKVVASPLAMATVAASVARGGVVVPRLLTRQQPDGAAPASPVTPVEGEQLRALMRGVVTRGSGSFLASLPGAPVLAKTGTAEFGARPPLQTHAWMIAVHGDLAVAVFVDVGASGSGTAGPVLERFLRAAG
jgi:cell division protein FtsI/penicillin-binding protein 2